jgi:acyl-coenzyme A synthetase/AMP-(fatty) acid ligase
MSLCSLLKVEAANSNRALVLASGEGHVVSVSYATLHQSRKELCDKLQLAGLGSGDVIGLVSPHSLETALILVGLAVSGLTCAPIDPSTSTQRFKKILEETGAKLVLVCASFLFLFF